MLNAIRKPALLTVALLLLLGGLVAPVHAHANLIRSDPPANSVIPTAPHQVTLSFSEQVEPKFTGASVYDSNGKEVDTGYHVDPADPTILIISLGSLPSGVYTVTWHAISAVDGHHTNGSFPFGVGNVTISVQQNNNSSFSFPSPVEVLERWLNLLADAVFLGVSIFALAVWTPTFLTTRDRSAESSTRKILPKFARLLVSSAGIALLGTGLSLIVQSYTVASSSSLTEIAGQAYVILFSTRLGAYWIFRLAVAIAAIGASAFILRTRKTSRNAWGLVLPIGLLLSLSTSLTSHDAAATTSPVLGLLSDWIHLVAVGAWVGGLACLVLIVIVLKELEGNLLAELVRRFSSVALVSVGVIGLTGLYNLSLEVGSLSALFGTPYGQILLVKLTIFAVMLLLGATNQFVFYDHLAREDTKPRNSKIRRMGFWRKRFRFSVRAEIALGIILLLVVGILTASAPVPPTVSGTQAYKQGPKVLQGYSVEGVNVTVKIYPFQVGANHFEFDFTNTQGGQVINIKSVSVKFSYLDRNIGVSTAIAQQNGATYTLDGTFLSFPGNWRLEVWAQRTQGYDLVVPFQVDVPALAVRFSELPLSSNSEPYGITVDNHGVVWFAESGNGEIASYDPATQALNAYALPRSGSRPLYLTADENGSIWISDTQFNRILRFETASRSFKEYMIPTSGAVPGGIATDTAGNVWFTEEIAGKIGRLVPGTGAIIEFPIPTNESIPVQLAIDNNGMVWFTEFRAERIGRLNPTDGSIDEFPASNATLLGPTGIAIGPNDTVWFTEHGGNKITMFDPRNQSFRTYQLSNNQAFPFGLAFDKHDRIWFVEHIGNAIGTLDLNSGRIDIFQIPNPSSDVQLLAVDGTGNVWFTLPAIGVLGVLTSTTSGLELQSGSSSTALIHLVIIAAVAIVITTPVVFLLGQRRMRKITTIRHRSR